MRCTSCGHELPEGSNFCSSCGASATGARALPETLPEAERDGIVDHMAIDELNAINIQSIEIPFAPASDNTAADSSGDAASKYSNGRESAVRDSSRMTGVATVEIADLLYATGRASLKKHAFRLRYIMAPAAVIGVAALVTAAILFYNASGVGAARALLSLLRDIDERFRSTPFAVSEPLLSCLNDGSVTAELDYTDEYGDDFRLNLTLTSDIDTLSRRLRADAVIYETPLDFELFADAESAALGSSLLGEDYYGLRYNTFNTDLAAFAASSGLTDTLDFERLEGYVSFFRDFMRDGGKGKSSKASSDGLTHIMLDFVKEHPPEETRERINRGGKTVSASVYVYTFTTADITGLLRNCAAFMRSDTYIHGQLERFIAAYDEYGYYSSPFPGDYPGENADNFLNDIEYILDFLDSVSSGTFTAKLFAVRGRLSAFELELDIMLEGSPLRGIISIDFGLDADDDWFLIGSLRDAWYEYSFGAQWLYSGDGDIRINTLTLSYGDKFNIDKITFNSSWDTESGVFALSARAADGSVDTQLGGSLTAGGGGFLLRLDSAAALRLVFSGVPNAELEFPDYVSIGKWDADTVKKFETAISDAYLRIYLFG